MSLKTLTTVLIIVIVLSGSCPFLARPASAQGTPPDDPALLNPLRSIAKDSLKAFVDAPLFDPTRHRRQDAPVAIDATPIVPEDAPPDLHLLGVIQGKRDVAIIRRDDDPKTAVLATGDHVGAWRVTILPTTGIRLSNGKRAFDYMLFAKGPKGGPVSVPTSGETGLSPAVDIGNGHPLNTSE